MRLRRPKLRVFVWLLGWFPKGYNAVLFPQYWCQVPGKSVENVKKKKKKSLQFISPSFTSQVFIEHLFITWQTLCLALKDTGVNEPDTAPVLMYITFSGGWADNHQINRETDKTIPDRDKAYKENQRGSLVRDWPVGEKWFSWDTWEKSHPDQFILFWGLGPRSHRAGMSAT